ncbi:MAG: acyl-CoA dehydrogenase family protein [Proteobacteria bacterium]|nr:acyl-CoA dehydrogenase family protein [Pseudomonadota bacterium]MBU4597083.1 acyl-CoA dehydrogenase family protein [Pseudomonadota bacterium]MBV1715325.1 acyl-CoA dehydrogenase family protein [Desulfarculus sp.]
MLGFELDEQQRMIQKTAHDFAARELRPIALQCDLSETYPRDLISKGHEAGLIAFHFPEEYGGASIDDRVSWTLVREELSWGCPGLCIAMMASNLAAVPILHMGSPPQKEKYLTRLADPANPILAAMAMTEPDAGSDVSSIRTTAAKKGDSYILNGRKTFITNGGIADVTVVYCRMEGTRGMEGMTAFVVDGKPKGFSMGKKEEKMGIRASHTSELILEDVEVPAEDRLGPEGEAFLLSMHMFDESRIMVAALALGIARAALEIAVDYAGQRVQFSKSLNKFEGISFKLSDMAMRLDAARLLTWRAAWLAGQGKRMTRQSAMAKCYAAETAHWVCDQALQILGGYGYMREYLVEKLYRDSRIFRIFEGTSEIMRLIIARELYRA